jgi:hypothetical protein
MAINIWLAPLPSELEHSAAVNISAKSLFLKIDCDERIIPAWRLDAAGDRALEQGGFVSFTANQELPTDLRNYPRIMGENQGSAMINELLTKS